MQEQINDEQQRLREQLQFKQAEIAAKQVYSLAVFTLKFVHRSTI